MNAKIVEALEASVEKWRMIVAGTGADEGRVNCALCQMFNPRESHVPDEIDAMCLGCPIMAKTGQQFCEGTPFETWAKITDQQTVECVTPLGNTWARTPESKAAADSMLRFLVDLLEQARAEPK